MMDEAVSHKGHIVALGKDSVSVEILSQADCASCHASTLCGLSESKKKLVEVPVKGLGQYEIGQEVEVCLAKKAGMKAVLLSYVLPVLILLILILSLSMIGIGELASGVISILGVAAYYFVLFLFRDRLAEGYEFYIRR